MTGGSTCRVRSPEHFPPYPLGCWFSRSPCCCCKDDDVKCSPGSKSIERELGKITALVIIIESQ